MSAINSFDTNLRRVLLITYLYPPVENAGTRPVEKFAKYLPEFGYRPVILTTGNYGRLPDDADRMIYRADELFGFVKQAYRALKLRHVPLDQRGTVGLLPPGGRLERWKFTYMVPDPKIIWYPLAVRQGRKVLRSQSIRLLYSTSPPETTHLIALKLKQETGLPWVADFRDGWLFEPLIAARLSSKRRHQLEAGLEQKVMLAADRVITVNEVIAADMAQRYPKAATKISVIPNGYDPDDFAQLQRQPAPPNKFRLVYTGSLSLSRQGTSLSGLLKALQAMHASNLPIMKHLEVTLVGNLAATEVRAIEQAGVCQYFSLIGPVPYRQALQYQVDADILLLVVAPNTAGVSTSKLFEYLAAGRPIIALTGPSAAANLISNLDAGVVVKPDDSIGIQQALQTLYQQWQAGQLTTRRDPRLHQFDRRELTRQLAKLFDELEQPLQTTRP
jgi:glycosyltransferase involved in cell wall biosynthesis